MVLCASSAPRCGKANCAKQLAAGGGGGGGEGGGRWGDRLLRLRDSGFLAVDVVEDAELLPAIASVHV